MEDQKEIKRCYGYIRVSTTMQAQDGLSLENQETKIKAWANYHEYELIKVFADEGISGKTIEARKQLMELLSVIQPGETFVVHSLSRLSRCVMDFLAINKKLKDMGCQLVVLKEGFDTTTPNGRFSATLFAALAELESDLMGDRIKESMKMKKEKKEHVGRAPYGWKLAPGGKQCGLIEVPEEQAIIVYCRKLRETKDEKGKQLSYNAIATRLNKEKVCLPKDSSEWHHNTVNRIINRGEVHTKGREKSEH